MKSDHWPKELSESEQLAELSRQTPEGFALLASFVTESPDKALRLAEAASRTDRWRAVSADIYGQLAATNANLRPNIARPLIAMLREETDPDVLNSIIVALGHSGAQSVRDEVERFAEFPDHRVRFAVAWALPSLMPNRQTVSTLIRLSSDPDIDTRSWATLGLAHTEFNDPDIRNALSRRLDDQDAETRAEAILGLALRGEWAIRDAIDAEIRQGNSSPPLADAIRILETRTET